MSKKWMPSIGQSVGYQDGSEEGPMVVVDVFEVDPATLEFPGEPPRYWATIRHADGTEGGWWAEDLLPTAQDE